MINALALPLTSLSNLFSSKAVVVIISLVLFAHAMQYRSVGNNWGAIVTMDGFGYYGYLPYAFETGFESFGGYCDFVADPGCTPFYMREQHGKAVDKYYAGTALLCAPFYLAGQVIARAYGVESNGYSKINFYSIAAAACFYLLLGLWAMRKVFLMLGFSDGLVSLLLLTVTMGTNIYWYTVHEPGISHIYSFALMNCICLVVCKWKRNASQQNALWFYFLLGLLVLSRPTNALFIFFIPFFLSLNEAKKLFLFVAGWPLFCAIVFIQFLLYKLQCGHWLVWSYKEEFFDFTTPHFFDTWLGSAKGLIWYFPILALSILGIVMILFRNWKRGLLLLFPLIFLFYVLSCWTSWRYGWSMGMRGYIEFYIFLIIPIAWTWQFLSKKFQGRIFLTACFSCCLAYTIWIDAVAESNYSFMQGMDAATWQAIMFKSPEEVKVFAADQ